MGTLAIGRKPSILRTAVLRVIEPEKTAEFRGGAFESRNRKAEAPLAPALRCGRKVQTVESLKSQAGNIG